MLRDHLKKPRVLISLFIIGVILGITAYFTYWPIILWHARGKLATEGAIQANKTAKHMVWLGEDGVRLVISAAANRSFPFRERPFKVLHEIIRSDELFNSETIRVLFLAANHQ